MLQRVLGNVILGHLAVAAMFLGGVLGGCKQAPPQPRLEWTPSGGQVKAGETIEVRATKPIAHQKEVFSYTWSMAGACQGAITEPSAVKVAYEVPADCAGGDLTFTLVATSRLGSTTQSTTFRIAAAPKKAPGLLPVRVDPLPANWEMLNDYEGNVVADDKGRRNRRNAPFGTWTYRDGRCDLTQGQDGQDAVLQVDFALPHKGLSSCGIYDYLAGEHGAAQPGDLSGFIKFGFIARTSGTAEPVRFRVEAVEFDKYANYDQGIVSESEPFVAGPEWRRYEILLKPLAATWDLKHTKSIGFRIDAKDDNPQKGVLLFDNLVLIAL